MQQGTTAYGIAVNNGQVYLDINSLSVATQMATTEFMAVQDGGTTTTKISLANLSNSIMRKIFVTSVGSPSTTLAAMGGNYEHEMIMVYGSNSTTVPETFYVWHIAQTTTATSPYVINSTNNGGGQWWAAGPSYKQGSITVSGSITASNGSIIAKYIAGSFSNTLYSSTSTANQTVGAGYMNMSATSAPVMQTFYLDPYAQNRTFFVINASPNGTKVLGDGTSYIHMEGRTSVAGGWISTVDPDASCIIQAITDSTNKYQVLSYTGKWTMDDVTPIQAGLVNQAIAGGRLTLSETNPVPTSDITGTNATTLYYLPYISNLISLYNGSQWACHSFDTNGISLYLADTTADTNYDVFAYYDGTQVQLELSSWATSTGEISAATGTQTVTITNGTNAHGLAVNDVVAIRSVEGKTEINGVFNVTGTATTTFDVFCYATNTYTTGGTWSKANTARTGYSLNRQDGVKVKSTDVTRKHIGWLRIGGTAGQSEDSGVGGGGINCKRFLLNRYNRITQRTFIFNQTSHTYNSSTSRPFNWDNNLKIQFMYCGEYGFNSSVYGKIESGGAGEIAIGKNRNNAAHGQAVVNGNSGTGPIAGQVSTPQAASSTGMNSEGYNFIQGIEYLTGTSTTTTTFDFCGIAIDLAV